MKLLTNKFKIPGFSTEINLEGYLMWVIFFVITSLWWNVEPVKKVRSKVAGWFAGDSGSGG